MQRLTLVLLGLVLSAAGLAAQAPPSTQTQLGDDWTTTKIQAQYFLDPNVKARTIDVATVNGMVTLTGVVASEAERVRAISIARGTEGVKQVNDRLTIQGRETEGTAGTNRTEPAPADPPQSDRPTGEAPGGTSETRLPGADELERVVQTDAAILTQVKTKLALDPDVNAFGIDVDVDEGVVRLTGTVSSEQARRRAVELARTVRGVSAVEERLTIRP